MRCISSRRKSAYLSIPKIKLYKKKWDSVHTYSSFSWRLVISFSGGPECSLMSTLPKIQYYHYNWTEIVNGIYNWSKNIAINMKKYKRKDFFFYKTAHFFTPTPIETCAAYYNLQSCSYALFTTKVNYHNDSICLHWSASVKM